MKSVLIGVGVLFFAQLARCQSTCPTVPSVPEDRRFNKSALTIVTFNLAFLFDGVNDTAAARDVWPNRTEALRHVGKVAEQIRAVNGDILCLQEVEDCSILQTLNSQLTDMNYKYYLVKGTDTATGQNTALLTRIDPIENLQRFSYRADTPVSNSSCNPDAADTTSISKHFVTRFNISRGNNNSSILSLMMLCLHLKSGGDRNSCAQREGQAKVAQQIIAEKKNNSEVIVLGDFNDFSDLDPDYNAYTKKPNVPTSKTIRMIRQWRDDGQELLFAQARNISQGERWSAAIGYIDHVLVTPGVDTLPKRVQIHRMDTGNTSSQRLANGYSDHYPVSTTYVLTSAPSPSPSPSPSGNNNVISSSSRSVALSLLSFLAAIATVIIIERWR